jgi:thiol-disulfide isomerase/thioredoxin
VLVDAGKDGKNLDVAAMYKADVVNGGYPYLTILDAAGNVLANQETGTFETKPSEGGKPGHDGEKVLAFLKTHEAKPLAADIVLKEARDAAKSSGRSVFLHFGAPWCGWCKKMEAWMARPNIAAALGKDFVDVKVDQDRMTNAKEVFAMYKKERAGIPWFVIIDAATGEPLATSDGPKGNVGFPANDEEIAHFMAMMKKTAKKMSEADLNLLKRTLEEGRKN